MRLGDVTAALAFLLAVVAGCLIVVTYRESRVESQLEQTTRRAIATQQCLENVAYPRSLMGQCVDDYYRMRGWRP